MTNPPSDNNLKLHKIFYDFSKELSDIYSLNLPNELFHYTNAAGVKV